MSEEGKTEEIKLEDENLNQEEAKTFTLEEVEAMKKEMQSNSEKGVQKILNEKKAYSLAMSKLNDISDDESSLIALYSENEEAGKIILDTYYNGKSIEDFKKDIDYKVDYNDPKTVEKLIEDKVKAREIEKTKAKTDAEINDKKEQFIKEYKMSGDELKSFNEEFEDRKNLKSFSLKTIQDQLTKAYRDSNGDEKTLEKIKQDRIIANTLGGTGGKGAGKNTPTAEKQKDKMEKEIDNFFNKFS